MAVVNNKLKVETVPNPLGTVEDAWADFRDVEVIGLEWTQTYKHSLGKYSRFFLALEEGQLLATRCPQCDRTWLPPRPACPECLQVTKWIELSGQGVLVSWSILHYAPKMLVGTLETPYILAYVRLEGADTLFAHLLTGIEPAKLEAGMRISAVFNQGPVDHPIMLMSFQPALEK
ncbi:MAG: Zn-ribbon domain-containing OB-fold protein [Candidatus Promineifilaceae bacterium]